MKKLMLGLMMAFAVTAEAAVMIDGFKYELDVENKTATLTGHTGSPTKVDVSEVEYEGQKYTVTSVGTKAFAFCSSLTEISLPNATMIGGRAFTGSPLTSVFLPNVTTIGGSAFLSCQLTSLSLPNATTIGENAFYDCPLAAVSLPNATTIGVEAFQDCTNLTTVSLLSVVSIGEDAFGGVRRIVRSDCEWNYEIND